MIAAEVHVAVATSEDHTTAQNDSSFPPEWQHLSASYEPQSLGEHTLLDHAGRAHNGRSTPYLSGQLPPPMAAIPEAVEGMQLSQRFSGAAQQLQADMDALKMSLETLDFGMQQISECHVMHCDTAPLHNTSGHDLDNHVSALGAHSMMPAHVTCPKHAPQEECKLCQRRLWLFSKQMAECQGKLMMLSDQHSKGIRRVSHSQHS